MQRRRSQRASEKDVDGRDEPGHDGMIQCERVRISGATSPGPVFDAGSTRRPGALLKWHWPRSARTFATALPFASMFPWWQGRERSAPSLRIRWRGSKIARACALNVSGAWPIAFIRSGPGSVRHSRSAFAFSTPGAFRDEPRKRGGLRRAFFLSEQRRSVVHATHAAHAAPARHRLALLLR